MVVGRQMPATEKSPAASARRNVTEIIGRYEALALEVCVDSGHAAIYASTRHGRVVITTSLEEFIFKMRAARDANGNRMPTAIEFLESQRHAAQRDEAEVIALPERKRPRPRGTIAPLVEQAWLVWKADPTKRLAEVAAPLGLAARDCSAYFRKLHGSEYAALRQRPSTSAARRPVLKPGGRLL
jgi:hypothetical protein